VVHHRAHQVFALQRAKTAREAIKIMGALAEQYGYGDYGEALTLADTQEAWLFEIVGPGPLWKPGSGKPGAHWVAVRVPDDSVTVSTNTSRIGEVNPADPTTSWPAPT
jgi:dipeptidase